MQEPTSPNEPRTAPLRVLLVEDSPSDGALLQESLSEGAPGEFRFTVAESWAEANARLQDGAFDVLLLDLSLPDVTGRETFQRARARAPQMPIVVLTSMEDESVGLAAVRQGVQDYLVKGQSYGRSTVRAIRYAIERKQTEEALKRAEANLQRERDQLEVRVGERTAELLAANRALQAEILQRQRAEEAHQQVLRRLAEAQETERGRISRELHDRLGQDLTALKLGLQIIRRQGPFSNPVQNAIGNLEKLTEGLMRDIHRLAWELRPSSLDDLGLELALRRFTSEWSESSGIPVDFHAKGLESQRIPAELETTLYRVAQEALTNISRHAKANRVSVLLERRLSLVSLIVEDNGQGFDAARVIHSSDVQDKLGLLGMQERVKLARGTLELESSPGAGTSLFVRLPLESALPVEAPSEGRPLPAALAVNAALSFPEI